MMKVVIATAVILNTITSSLAQLGSEANERALRQSDYLRQSDVFEATIIRKLNLRASGGGRRRRRRRRRIQDLSALATWGEKQPPIDPMMSFMSLSMSFELTMMSLSMSVELTEVNTDPPKVLPDDIYCTWKKWFEDDFEHACLILNDGYHTVPYTCDVEYTNVCCSESSILNPKMKLFGTCYKTNSVRDINSVYHPMYCCVN